MKNYYTARSDEGLSLPYSGRIFGILADAMRLKSPLREAPPDVSYKTVQRYFKGERIATDAVKRIVKAMIDFCVPSKMFFPWDVEHASDSILFTVHEHFQKYAQMWDACVSRLNDNCFPVSEPRDLPIPFLRLLALEFGIRWASWARLRGSAPLYDWFIKRNPYAHTINRLRGECSYAYENLADETGVSTQTIQAWCSGKSLPTNDHIEALGAALSKVNQNRANTEFTLRIAVALQALYQNTKFLCGEHRTDDMVHAMNYTAQLVYNELPSPSNENKATQILSQVAIYGTFHPLGRHTAKMLASRTPLNAEVAADFNALPDMWIDRAAYWLKELGTIPRAIESMKSEAPSRMPAMTPQQAESLVKFSIQKRFSMRGIAKKPNPDKGYVTLKLPIQMRAANRMAEAERAESIGDLRGAIKHLAHAAVYDPNDALCFFKLGANLGRLGNSRKDTGMMREGIVACRQAVKLDPHFGNARNEIGIILSNLRLHEEAEEAFSEAEPHHGEHAHHWLCRGNNYLMLEQFQSAEEAFRKAISANREKEHILAMCRLSAILMKRDKIREAKRIGKHVQKRTKHDPTSIWEHWLDPWCDQRNPSNKHHYKAISNVDCVILG